MIRVLPFKHKAKDFLEAVGMTSEEVRGCLAEPPRFDNLSPEKKLRMVACLGHIAMRMLSDYSHPVVKLFFYLSFGSGERVSFSEHVEVIENNLMKMLERENEPIEDTLRSIFVAIIGFLRIIGEASLVIDVFEDSKSSNKVTLH